MKNFTIPCFDLTTSNATVAAHQFLASAKDRFDLAITASRAGKYQLASDLMEECADCYMQAANLFSEHSVYVSNEVAKANPRS